MSAWIVSKNHIDTLVYALGSRELVTDRTPDEIGRTLWIENVLSIWHRYPDTFENDTDYPGPTGFVAEDALAYCYAKPDEIDDDSLLKQIRCYDYQSCEHPEWETSKACLWMATLQNALITAGASINSVTANNAPWGV